MAAFTQWEIFHFFACSIPAFCCYLLFYNQSRTATTVLPHGLHKADNRWVFLLILSRLKDHWIRKNKLELDRGSKFKKQDTWQALYLKGLRGRSLSHWQPDEYLAQLMGAATQHTKAAKPDRKGCRSSPTDKECTREDKGLGSNTSIFSFALGKSKNPHNTPIMQSDLSDNTMQTILFWQEDESSFNRWLSRQIISN